MRDLAEGLEARLDGQFTYQWDIGDDLAGTLLDDTWNVGVRASTSVAGAVFRLGVSITGSNASIANLYGDSPSYVDLMQRGFNLPDEKALLASVSYDVAGVGVEGLTAIVNFVAGFDGKLSGHRDDVREVDLTVDYRVKKGRLANFWLRVRGSYLTEDSTGSDGTDIRVILRFDIPVI